MGLVSTTITPMLLKLVAQHKLDAEKFATHPVSFDQVLEAYETFAPRPTPRRSRWSFGGGQQ